MEGGFNYSDLGPGEIRVLKLLPGRRKDSIQIELQHVQLDDAEYNAISYCWGDPNDKRKITCNGRDIAITNSLHSALTQFRHQDGERILWADAVCINQSNDAEKSQQVALIAEIYKRSQSTLIWLGVADKDSDKGIDFAKRVTSINQDAAFAYMKKPWSVFGGIAFLDILSRPWFRRVWIIQEVGMSVDRAVVHCGSSSISWDEFCHVMPRLVNTGLTLLGGFRLETIMWINLGRRDKGATMADTKSTIQRDLLSTLIRYQRFNATNPLDKVFGLLGLVDYPSSTKFRVQLDYSQTVRQLYQSVAAGLIEQDRSLDILGAPKSLEDPFPHGWPTWIHDWSKQDHENHVRLVGILPNNIPFHYAASKGSVVDAKIQDDILELSGCIFQQIVAVGEMYPVQSLEMSDSDMEALGMGDLRKGFIAILSWEDVSHVRAGRPYVTGEPIEEAYRHTLTGKHITHGLEYDQRTFKSSFDYWARIRHIQRWRILDSPLAFKIAFNVIGTAAYISQVFLRDSIPVLSLPDVDFANTVGAFCRGRRMFRTSGGYIGLAPNIAEEGDWVVLLKGGKVPHVLRPRGEDWVLVGDCYVHGIMYGEAWDGSRCKTIRIV